MIVQPSLQAADAGTAHFVMTNAQHAAFAGRLAGAFGNDEFPAIDPVGAFMDLVLHHDDGWNAIDADPPLDPATGLPYTLERTPPQYLFATMQNSPDLNEARGALQGVLDSMHICGIYNGRYGLAEKLDLSHLPAGAREKIEQRLAAEAARQQRLKAQLRDQGGPDERALFAQYKLLQFFDMLALYFNRRPASTRGEQRFLHVPRIEKSDATVQVTELPDGRYAFQPFPFCREGQQVFCEGRYLPADTSFMNGAQKMASGEVARQSYTLVPG